MNKNLNAEAERASITEAGGVTVGVSVAFDTTERIAVARNRRTLPPIGSFPCVIVPILRLAVPSRVIVVLFEIVRLLR